MEIAVSTTKYDTKRRALGKGLESLLPSRPVQVKAVVEDQPLAVAAAAETAVPVAEPTGKPIEIELNRIVRNPLQTRTHFDREKLAELARSIEATGVIQPIVVRDLGDGRYQLVMGERRWLASFDANKTHIPAFVREVSDEQAMEMTIVENLQRADLNPMEQARAYQRLSTDFKMSQNDMAIRTGMPRTTVTNYIRLMKLPESVQQKVEAGALSFGHAKILLSLEGPEEIAAAAQKVLALSMSVRQTETYVQGLLNPESKKKLEKPEPVVDPNVKDMQNELQRTLGLRVKIEDHAGKGKVIIEYTGVGEFDAIMEAMGIKR
jgi:ParB family chromosome partitioning protein